MVKRPTEFPKVLSECIKWDGPTLSEFVEANYPYVISDEFLCLKSKKLPVSSLPDEEQEKWNKKKADLEERWAEANLKAWKLLNVTEN
jgi:hypothetical protein